MIAAIKTLAQDTFLKNNAIMFLGSMSVAFLNYLYHPVLSRIMTIEHFGEVQAILSLVMQVGILGTVFSYIAVNLVTNREQKGNLEMLSVLHTIGFLLMLVPALGIALFAPFLKAVFQFGSVLPFYALAAGLLIGIESAFYRAYLQGTGHFGAISVFGVIQAGGKLILAIVLVLAGLQTFGAVMALTLASLFGLLYMLYRTRGKLRLPFFQRFRFNARLRQEFLYGVLVFFSLGFVTVLSSIDVIIVKSLFPPLEAGLYSGISTVSRVIFFATGSVAGVLLATVKRDAGFERNSLLLRRSLRLVLLIGSGALACFLLFPETVIQIMIGQRYLGYSFLLPKLGLLMLIVSVINLIVNYFLAIRRFLLLLVLFPGAVLFGTLAFALRGTIGGVVDALLLGSLATLAMLLLTYGNDYRRHRIKKT